MSDRTVISVVSDLIKTGLTVEQQILVNELVIVAADEQRGTDYRSYERERKRTYREKCPGLSRTVPDKRKEPKENNIYITPLEGESEGKPLSGTNLNALFEAFWEVYPRKVAKGAARKAYRNALKRASHADILAGVKRYKPADKTFTKHPASWLNADCWLDEIDSKVVQFSSGPKRTWAEIKAERDRGNNEVG